MKRSLFTILEYPARAEFVKATATAPGFLTTEGAEDIKTPLFSPPPGESG
jgi:hypothetical protein